MAADVLHQSGACCCQLCLTSILVRVLVKSWSLCWQGTVLGIIIRDHLRLRTASINDSRNQKHKALRGPPRARTRFNERLLFRALFLDRARQPFLHSPTSPPLRMTRSLEPITVGGLLVLFGIHPPPRWRRSWLCIHVLQYSHFPTDEDVFLL